MATTRISDIIVPEVFHAAMMLETKTKSNIWNSGILRSDGTLASDLSGGGLTFNVKFFRDLADDEANIASDDPADIAATANITQSKDVAIRQYMTKAWTTAALSADLSGDDPAGAIAGRASSWWDRYLQRRLVSTLKGVYADNVANFSSDMVFDVSTNSTVGATNRVTPEAILDAKQTLGDAGEDLSVLIMHSQQYTQLQKQNLIDFIPSSDGRVRFATYLGYRVIVDDRVATGLNGSNVTYTMYLAATGSVAYVEAPPRDASPVEIKWEALQGGGAGVETLITRKQFILHPYGVKWNDNVRAAQFPAINELELATNWTRVYPERKQVGLAFLVVNG